MVVASFGEGKGMIIEKPHGLMLDYQLEYFPKYVVTDDQITGLCNGAYALLKACMF